MTIRFYAACLASYNNGVLHGRWIDASSDKEEMQEEINAMLRQSKFPNVTVECPECDGQGFMVNWSKGRVICPECKGKCEVPSAEEWAIHDYDNMPDTFGEFVGLDTIAEYVEFIKEVEDLVTDDEQAQELAKGMLDCFHTVEEAKSELEKFLGVYDSFRDYSDESADEMIACHASDGKIPEFLTMYFDYESYACDLAIEMTTVDLPGGVAVFHQ